MTASYRDLRVWKKAMSLVLEVYRVSKEFPNHETYGLVAQLRRAAVSIPSNIAEGKGRSSDREYVLFLHHARGSLLEVETQLMISHELKYVTDERTEDLLLQTANVAKGLNALINSMRIGPVIHGSIPRALTANG